jgi:hypothetical protein
METLVDRGRFIVKLPGEVTFASEELTHQLLAEMTPLLASHWDEIGHFKDIPLNPDYSYYRSMASSGVLRIFTYRRATQLVGYAVFVVRTNPHYRTSLQAHQDILYLDPQTRGIMSMRFIEFCDDALRSEGVQVVYQHSKAAHDFGRLLKHIGYEHVDQIYARRLDKED